MPNQATPPDRCSPEGLSVVITYPFALGTQSGGSTVVFETARALARFGVDLVLLPVSTAKWTRLPRRPVSGELLGEERRRLLEAEGVEVVPVRPHPLTQWLEGRAVARALDSVLARRRVDVVLGFHQEASSLPQRARRGGLRFGMIAIWQSYRMTLEEAPSGRGLVEPLVRWLNRRVLVEPLRGSEVLFALSEFTRRELVELIGVEADRVRICYLGVDPVFGTVPRGDRGRVERIVFFGRLVRTKGVFDALDALADVARRGRPEFIFRVMGDGDAEAVRRYVEELGLGRQVEIKGFQGREALLAELEWADLALMPSHSESFGLSNAEAQASGIPVVAYDCGSVPEIVQHGVSGWLAPFGDTERLGRYVEAAMEDPAASFRAGQAGRERVLREFTWERTAERILTGLRELR